MNKRKFEFASELIREMEEKPFSKISISDICENLKCSRQSFYYYFKTLDDCLAYYIKESFKSRIKEDYLISDIFNYVEINDHIIKIYMSDAKSNELFWNGLYSYCKKLLDLLFSKNVVDYLTLYTEQKEAITSFYIVGLLELAKQFSIKNLNPSKDKCISYCKAIMGSGDDIRDMMRRFNR